MTKIFRASVLLLGILIASACHNSSSESSTETPEFVSRGPYLQIPTPTSITIRWRSKTPSFSIVYYGTSINELTSRVTSLTAKTDHEVMLDNLQPDTRYFYEISNVDLQPVEGNEGYSFVTPPVHGSDKSVRIWVLGDSGTADVNAAAVRDAYRKFVGPDEANIMLMLGDNAYYSGTDEEYQAAVFDMYPSILRKIPIWPTFGNHEGHTSDSSTETGPYYEIFTLPTNGEAGGLASGTEAYYSFDHANIHFVCLNSHDIDKSPSGNMLTWLKNDLAATNQVWRIAYWHHPPYSKGTHDSDSELSLVEMRENVLSILELYGVDIVLSGHSHVYERSFLLDGHYGDSTTLSSMMILDGGDGRVSGDGAYFKPGIEGTPNEGAVYTVMGSSGSAGFFQYPHHPAMFSSQESLGSLILDVADRQLDVTFIDDSGSIRDFFRINKGP